MSLNALLAQWIARDPSKVEVVGSTPIQGKNKNKSDMVQWLGFLSFTENAGVRFPVSEKSPVV